MRHLHTSCRVSQLQKCGGDCMEEEQILFSAKEQGRILSAPAG